jgi:hypothetical protein
LHLDLDAVLAHVEMPLTDWPITRR